MMNAYYKQGIMELCQTQMTQDEQDIISTSVCTSKGIRNVNRKITTQIFAGYEHNFRAA